MHCFIVGPDRDEARRTALAGLAGHLGYPTVAVASLGVLAADARFVGAARPLVLVAQSPLDPLATGDIVAFAQAQQDHAFVVYVADTIDPDTYKQLVRTGSAEWIRWQDSETELLHLTGRLLGPETGERTAKIVSFLPSKGGVGNTTLVVETAVTLAAKRKRAGGRVAILDLNLQGGTVADALDIEPRFDVAEIVASPERLDEQLIDVFTSRHSPRLDVFAGPSRMVGPEEVGPQIIFAFIDGISSRYDVILFDLPQVWLPWIDNLLQGSDAVVVSGGTNVPALRKLSGKLAYLKDLGVPENRLAAVLNQAEVDLLGRVTRRSEIERVLSGHRTFFVRRDHAAVDEACDVGRPLLDLLPNSRIGRDIRRLTEWVETAVGWSAPAVPEAKVRQGSAA